MSGLRIKTGTTLLITAFIFASAQAQEDTPAASSKSETPTTPTKSESYLKEIRDCLLVNINKLPVYLHQLTKMALSWLAPDDSDITATQQNNFATLANLQLKNSTLQIDSQNRFLRDFLTNPSLQNDIIYQTLLNQPYNPNTPSQPIDPAYAYTKYASALNVSHKDIPLPIHNKKAAAAQLMYINYYKTSSAIQTYNGYILSELYADFKNKNAVKQTQDSLIQKASDSDWFTQIASENIGIVLRQILLYNSQTYVLLAQLLETQKKLLASQAMNNALLISINQEEEGRLYAKANGQVPD